MTLSKYRFHYNNKICLKKIIERSIGRHGHEKAGLTAGVVALHLLKTSQFLSNQ